MSKLQAVRGTRDLIGIEWDKFLWIQNNAFELAKLWGYSSIETPIIEFSEVFHRTLGETSDIVHKETYTFTDRSGDQLTLRPEGTAGVARSFISEGLAQRLPLKLYYAGPMFRHERPQKGRYRQFYQLGVEALGYETPLADADCLNLAWNILNKLNLSNRSVLEINSIGDLESRQKYRQALVDYFSKYLSDLSPESQIRLQKNPLRILDSKDSQDQKIAESAPQIHTSYNSESQKFFELTLSALKDLQIPHKINSKLVRGLDYYCHTVFEFVTTELGSQGAILSGGRYDGLIETMGGPKTPGFGWAAGLDRLVELMSDSHLIPNSALIGIAPADDKGEAFALSVASHIRKLGLKCEIFWSGNLGKKLKKASSINTTHCLILGSAEAEQNRVTLKNMKSGEQKSKMLLELTPEEFNP